MFNKPLLKYSSLEGLKNHFYGSRTSPNQSEGHYLQSENLRDIGEFSQEWEAWQSVQQQIQDGILDSKTASKDLQVSQASWPLIKIETGQMWLS